MIVGNLVMSLAPPACAASRSTAATTPGTRNASWTNQVSSTSPRRVSSAVLTRQGGPGSAGPAVPAGGGAGGGGGRGGRGRGGRGAAVAGRPAPTLRGWALPGAGQPGMRRAVAGRAPGRRAPSTPSQAGAEATRAALASRPGVPSRPEVLATPEAAAIPSPSPSSADDL